MLKFRKETEFKETEIGEVPGDWEVKPLNESSFEIIMGQSPPSKYYNTETKGMPFIQGRKEFEDLYIKPTIYTEKCNKIAPENSVLITVRAPVGDVNITKDKICIGRGIAAIYNKTGETMLNHFIYYVLAGLKEYISSLGERGTTYEEIIKEDLENLLIPYPPLSEQSRIATVLSWFDDLIENKRRQNEILEKTAMAFFKSWFMDFEPFKDGEFAYSEELGKEIPKGWEVKRVGEVAEFYDHKRIPLSEIERRGRPGNYPYYGANGIIDYIDDYIFDGKYLLVSEDGNITDENGFAVSRIAEGKFWANNHVHIIQGKGNITVEFLYLLLKFTPILPFITGAVQPKLSQRNFIRVPLLLPPQPILQRFHSLVEPLFRKIILNQKEIMVLRKIRDTLLPQLVFGKLRVVEL